MCYNLEGLRFRIPNKQYSCFFFNFKFGTEKLKKKMLPFQILRFLQTAF